MLFLGLLNDLGLPAFREERFLMKITAQNEGVAYVRQTATVSLCGFFFPVPVPPARKGEYDSIVPPFRRNVVKE